MSPLVHTTTLHTWHPDLFADHLNQHVLFAFLLDNCVDLNSTVSPIGPFSVGRHRQLLADFCPSRQAEFGQKLPFASGRDVSRPEIVVTEKWS